MTRTITRKPAAKLDLFKDNKSEYASPKKPAIVQVGSGQYLLIIGRGAPGGDAFTEKLGALYAIAYTAKMASKSAGRDYKVCPLEGLWWGSANESDFMNEPRRQWNWKLLIRTPEFITQREVAGAIETARKKGKSTAVSEVQLDKMAEGRCVQMLHVGPYDAEDATIAVMMSFVAENDLAVHGLHHEIYLSDPRRVAPEKLRTILRFPVR